MESDRRTAWILILLTFAVALVMVVVIARNRDAVEGSIRSLGPAGPLLSLALYALLGLSPLPADPLTLINGAVFGPWKGALLAWAGKMLSAQIEYFIGARLGDAAELNRRRDELPDWLARASPSSIWFLLGGRTLTGVGSKLVSYISGAFRVPLPRYLWTSALSTLLGALLFALGGYGLINLF